MIHQQRCGAAHLTLAPTPVCSPGLRTDCDATLLQGGGGGSPFDMGRLMESVKKAQQLVQVETQRVQQELEK